MLDVGGRSTVAFRKPNFPGRVGARRKRSMCDVMEDRVIEEEVFTEPQADVLANDPGKPIANH